MSQAVAWYGGAEGDILSAVGSHLTITSVRYLDVVSLYETTSGFDTTLCPSTFPINNSRI